MEEKNIFCGECGEKNEPGYEYCKNCGTPLVRQEPIQSEYVGNQNTNAAHNGYQNFGYTNTAPDSIDGIKTDEIALFVGRKAPVFIPKFLRMEIIKSKTSWCWPVAILSLLLGPMGAALWFFYRKMYKWAWILFGIGFLNLLVTTFVRGDAFTYGEMLEAAADSGKISINDILSMTNNWRVNLSEFIDSVVTLLSAILLGLYSVNIYKNFAVKKIKETRENNSDPRYYRMGLSLVGGTSSGMVWVGILCLSLADAIGSYMYSIIKLF